MKTPDRKINLFVLATFVVTATIGCSSGADIGETVPGPPRELVEKTFSPPAAGGNTAPVTGAK